MTDQDVCELLDNLDREMFLDLATIENVKIELAYARSDNFTGENLYGKFTHAFAHRLAFEKLKRVAEELKLVQPQYKILIYDALRPARLQKIMFSYVEGTEQEPYVANPKKGSLHNYGMALDLTLLDENAQPLDMGAAFDQFDELSQPQCEEELLKSARLTVGHIHNRHLLRKLMINAGFAAIPNEWWHFNACTMEEAKQISKLVR